MEQKHQKGVKLEHRQRKNNIYIIGVLEKEKTKQLNFYNYKQIKFHTNQLNKPILKITRNQEKEI